MQNPPLLTDRKALALHRARATALFLQEEAVVEVQERLSEVNRRFTAPVVVTAFPALWPDFACITDDETLALTPAAQDLVVHALSLHWANDLVGQLVQCRRALQPDGLFLGLMFGGQTLQRPWFGDTMDLARLKADVAFEMFDILNAPFYCFHDADARPEGKTFAEIATALPEDSLRWRKRMVMSACAFTAPKSLSPLSRQR